MDYAIIVAMFQIEGGECFANFVEIIIKDEAFLSLTFDL